MKKLLFVLTAPAVVVTDYVMKSRKSNRAVKISDYLNYYKAKLSGKKRTTSTTRLTPQRRRTSNLGHLRNRTGR